MVSRYHNVVLGVYRKSTVSAVSYPWAVKERVGWAVRAGLIGYKIEKSKLTLIKANCRLHPLIYTISF